MTDEEIRGEEASRVLGSSVYKEAFRVIEERLVNETARVEITKERAEYIRTLLVANRKIRGYLEQVMVTGNLAEEQRSLIERAKDAAKAFRY